LNANYVRRQVNEFIYDFVCLHAATYLGANTAVNPQ
jgi:hypothetical protein